jgi:hypothetical protein
VAQMWAWSAMSMALLAWLAANHWAPSPEISLIHHPAVVLLFMSSYTLYMAVTYAVAFQKAKLEERRLVEEGKDTFGDEFAAAVQACRNVVFSED